MLRYPCLILDHDDTVVQSEASINYPYFCQILQQLRPGSTITLREYTEGCYYTGFTQMCKEKYGFSDAELALEYEGWKAYIRTHIPAPYPGIRELILRQKSEGGLVCVVSHSSFENISRDYNALLGIQPDDIYGWDYPAHQRKPAPYPVLQILEKYHLSPSQALVIDDMKPAWEMATAAGVSIGFAAWGRQGCPDIVQEMTRLCHYSFESPQSLSNFLFL